MVDGLPRASSWVHVLLLEMVSSHALVKFSFVLLRDDQVLHHLFAFEIVDFSGSRQFAALLRSISEKTFSQNRG